MPAQLEGVSAAGMAGAFINRKPGLEGVFASTPVTPPKLWVAEAAASPVFAVSADRLAEYWGELVAAEPRLVQIAAEPEQRRSVWIQRSTLFRFPDLVSDAALNETVRRDHLVALGADGWLVFGLPLRPGAILLVHPNGNEPAGLRLFSKLLDKGRLPRPFRPIDEAP